MKKGVFLKDLYCHLNRFHLSDSLYTLGAINSALKFGFIKPFTAGIHPHIIYILNNYLNESTEHARSLYLFTTRMARFLILSASTDYRQKTLTFGDKVFNETFDMVSNLLDPTLNADQIDMQTFDKMFARMSTWQFPLQKNKLDIIGRGHLLFMSIPTEMQLDYNFDEKLKEYFDVNIFEFIASGFAMWLTTNGTLDYELKNEVPVLDGIITSHTLQIFAKLSSGTPNQYRKLVRGDQWQEINEYKDYFALDPFVQMPAITIQNSKHLDRSSLIVPQPQYLLEKSSNGIFYLLADKERDLAIQLGKAGENPFRRDFGYVYREYVGRQLKQAPPNYTLIDLDNDFHNANRGKLPDFALIHDGICLLFEVKVSLLTIDARVYFEEDKLISELKKDGNLDKAIKQLNVFKKQILANKIEDIRFKNISRVVNVIVGYDDIYVLNSSLLPLIRKQYTDQATDLQLASISDIESIGTALAENLPLINIITEKIDNGDETHSIGVELIDRLGYESKNDVLQNSFIAFFKKMGANEELLEKLRNQEI